MPESEDRPLVVVRSLVYNHEPYLRDCLEGFVMQQTTFPFVAVVHDDCSTDNSAAILREYAEKYPHIIKPVYETENQYSKGTLGRVMYEACGKYGAKYYALCEGDDYWTDPHKLQKQVDFMEAHPDYSMVSCNAEVLHGSQRLVTHEDHVKAGWPHCDEERDFSTEEVIKSFGRQAQTAGLMVRSSVYETLVQHPVVCSNGDVKLQLTAAQMGKVHHMRDVMGVYRFMTPGSWNDRTSHYTPEQAFKRHHSLLQMLAYFDEWSGGKHHKDYQWARITHIVHMMNVTPATRELFLENYRDDLLLKNAGKWLEVPTGLVAALRKLCMHPYYPFSYTAGLRNAFGRMFCRTSRDRETYHIGPLKLVTVVCDRPKSRVYVLWKRVK